MRAHTNQLQEQGQHTQMNYHHLIKVSHTVWLLYYGVYHRLFRRNKECFQVIFNILEPCLYKCCVDHGLPVECINEETQSLKTDTLNDTHKAVEMIISDNCHIFAKILQDCKASCIPRKKGKTCKFLYNSDLEQESML